MQERIAGHINYCKVKPPQLRLLNGQQKATSPYVEEGTYVVKKCDAQLGYRKPCVLNMCEPQMGVTYLDYQLWSHGGLSGLLCLHILC